MAKAKRTRGSKVRSLNAEDRAIEHLFEAWQSTGCYIPTQGELLNALMAADRRYEEVFERYRESTQRFRVDLDAAQLVKLFDALPFTYDERKRIDWVLRNDADSGLTRRRPPVDRVVSELRAKNSRWAKKIARNYKGEFDHTGRTCLSPQERAARQLMRSIELGNSLVRLSIDTGGGEAEYLTFGDMISKWLATGSCFDRELFCRHFDVMGVDPRRMPVRGTVRFLRSGHTHPDELFVWFGAKGAFTLLFWPGETRSCVFDVKGAFHPKAANKKELIVSLREAYRPEQRHQKKWVKADQHPFDIIRPGALTQLRDHYALRTRDLLADRIEEVLKGSNIEP